MTLPLSVRRIAAAVDALDFTTHEASPTRLIAYRKDLRAGIDATWSTTQTMKNMHPEPVDKGTPWALDYSKRIIGPAAVPAERIDFDSATIVDPVGSPRELYFEYKPIKVYPGKDKSGRIAETEQSFAVRVRLSEEAADSMNRQYNDGVTVMDKQWMVTSTTQIHLWLNDWMDVLNVEHPRLPIPKPRATKAEKNDAAFAAGTEWSAE